MQICFGCRSSLVIDQRIPLPSRLIEVQHRRHKAIRYKLLNCPKGLSVMPAATNAKRAQTKNDGRELQRYVVEKFELDIRMKAFKLSLCAIPFHNAKKVLDLLLGGGLPFHHINHALLALARYRVR